MAMRTSDNASTVVSDWLDVGAGQHDATSLVAWLESKGLNKYVEKIVQVTDAEHVDDLKLLDADMVEDIIKAADMKLVTAQKFRFAMSELRSASSAGKTSQQLVAGGDAS